MIFTLQVYTHRYPISQREDIDEYKIHTGDSIRINYFRSCNSIYHSFSLFNVKLYGFIHRYRKRDRVMWNSPQCNITAYPGLYGLL